MSDLQSHLRLLELNHTTNTKEALVIIEDMCRDADLSYYSRVVKSDVEALLRDGREKFGHLDSFSLRYHSDDMYGMSWHTNEGCSGDWHNKVKFSRYLFFHMVYGFKRYPF